MKSLGVAIMLSGAILNAIAAQAPTQPSKREIGAMKRAAAYEVEKAFLKAGEPVAVANGNYMVPVTIAGKECKVFMRPSDNDLGPWGWEMEVMKCSK